MVQKLSGFAKFDLDTKISALQFYRLVSEFCQVETESEQPLFDDQGVQTGT
jgi:hypothetical protein